MADIKNMEIVTYLDSPTRSKKDNSIQYTVLFSEEYEPTLKEVLEDVCHTEDVRVVCGVVRLFPDETFSLDIDVLTKGKIQTLEKVENVLGDVKGLFLEQVKEQHEEYIREAEERKEEYQKMQKKE